ncbi:AAEL003740-PA [Aedes aegypti]|uniref:AAEL003740-PA n=1 Tax=Aedes aegypti TaxID=7159 RepID=Q17EL9_AEDAE|nr:AAEL003740-PA [Aedes aegypti]
MESWDFSHFDDYILDEEQSESEETCKIMVPRILADCYRIGSTGNVLHRAIRKGNEREIQAVLDVYNADFDKISNYLVKKYQWDRDDNIWMRKTNLIAIDEDSCRKCKVLEESSVDVGQDLERAIFVVLKCPINGEEVAVLHPTEENRIDLFRLVRELLPNGCLSWDYPGLQTDPNGKNETYVETAASCGKHDLITRLYELGAALGVPGHNALVAACKTHQAQTIHWLLTEHFDHFDFTQRNESQINGFHILLERNKHEMVDFVLQKMIDYRKKHLNETESQAFNNIFHYEEYDSSSTLTLVRAGPARKIVEEYIVRYKLDLSYQFKNVTILRCLLSRNLALDYCWETIRSNPKLLGLSVNEESTMVHVCIEYGHLDILKEMYEAHPEVKQYFETDGSFGCLQARCFEKRHEAVVFMLENHNRFFLKDLNKMKELISNIHYNQDVYDIAKELLITYLPSLRAELDEKKEREPVFYPGDDLKAAFWKYNLEFEGSRIRANDPTQSLSSVRGFKGVTLLHYAVDKNNIELCRVLMDSGCDIDAVDDEGNHRIHFVKSIEMLDFIIERYPSGRSLTHRTNTHGQTILHRIFSFYMNSEPLNALMEKIISYGADVNLKDNSGESIAFLIASDDLLVILEKYNLDLEVVNNAGESVLERHLNYRHVWLAQALLRRLHERPSFKDHAHKYLEPFMFSNRDFFSCDYQPFLEGNPETTKLIFDSVYNHSREEASRLFCKACGSAHIFITEKFLEFDYDLDYNYQDQDGYTPIIGLLSYMEEPNQHLVKQVLGKGVDLELRNSWGRTALLMFVDRFGSAKWYGHDEGTVALLLDHGASIDSCDSENGNTALHYAFQNNDFYVAEVLIRRGANLTVENNEGKKPLEMASGPIYELIKFIE